MNPLNRSKTINEFSTLKDNWDNYGAELFSQKTIELALKVSESIPDDFSVYPTGRDTIQFEFEDEHHYIELEIGKEYLGVLFMIDNKIANEDYFSNPMERAIQNNIEYVNILYAQITSEVEKEYLKLDMEKIKKKKSTVISSKEALKGIIPIDWNKK